MLRVLVKLDDGLLASSVNAAAEEEGDNDPNDLHTQQPVIETHTGRRTCQLAHLKKTKDDTNHSSSNGQTQQGIGVHTGTALRVLG